MAWDSGAEADTWVTGGGGQAAAADEFSGVNGYDGGDDTEGHATESGTGGGGGGCYNCGEEGHMKSECPNPMVAREFTGTCNSCGETGHRRSNCPTAGPKLCLNCEQEGHGILTCENPRKSIWPGVPDVAPEESWKELVEAAKDREIVDAKLAAQKYMKALPDIDYVQLEQAFRQLNIPIYLIAIEKETQPTEVLMDPQGNLKKTYCVTWQSSDKPGRGKNRAIWPESPEANLERLADAGHVVDCLMPKCSNCNELGHTKKHCPGEVMENADRAVVSCFNCGETGHRQRDCALPRPDKFACKNCGQSGHNSKECTEPRNMDNVECKHCNEKGHFASDCPTKPQVPCFNCGQTGHRKNDCTNEKVDICRNCDAIGHISKDCPKPKDWSRVKCQNCEEMGHTKVRCPKPVGGGDDLDAPGDDAGVSLEAGDYDDQQAAIGGDGGGDNWGSGDNKPSEW